MEPAIDKNQFRFACAALVIGTFAAYASVLGAGFINYDDIDYVTSNNHVKSGLTFGGIIWAFTTNYASNWHPLTWISLMLDAQVYGVHAWGFHLTNLLLHATNSVLLLMVLANMTGALWRSAIVAALFAWHPLHVESVAWIAERKDVLSGFFWLLTMWFYLRFAQAAAAGDPQKRKWYRLSLVFFVCGLLAKPMVVTLPFVLLLMDWWPLKRIADCGLGIEKTEASARASSALPLRQVLWEKAPFFALALISCVVTFGVQKSGKAVALLERIPLQERFANVLVSYAVYLRKAFWPHDLAVFYPFQHHLPAGQWVGAAMLLAVVSLLAIGCAKKRPYVAAGWFWYIGTLVPVIGLVQVGDQAMADRYTYLPLIGVFIILSWGVAELTEGWGRRKALLIAGAGVPLAIGLMLTAAQVRYWKDSITLFKHDLAVAGENVVACGNIGEALDRQGKTQEAKVQFLTALKIDPDSASTLNGLGVLSTHEGNLGKAIEYFKAALQKRPSYSDAHYGLGNVLAGEGNYAAAAEEYAAAISTKPDSADAYNNLGAMHLRLGKTNDALGEFKMALTLDPDFPEAHVQMGDLLLALRFPEAALPHYAEAVRLKPRLGYAHYRYGMLLAYNKQFDPAIFQFQDALKLEPTNAAVYYNLAAVYAMQNKLGAAADNFAMAARLNPKDAELKGRLAATLAVQGNYEESIKAYQDALRLRPDWPLALRDLAWMLATNPKPALRNGAEAVKLAERANALLPKPDARFLEALDAAYGEAGRFEDAVKTAEKVQQLATAAGEKDVADRAGQRVVLYKAGKPYHESSPQ